MVGWGPRQRPGLKGGFPDLVPEQPCDLLHARPPARQASLPQGGGRQRLETGSQELMVETHVQLRGCFRAADIQRETWVSNSYQEREFVPGKPAPGGCGCHPVWALPGARLSPPSALCAAARLFSAAAFSDSNRLQTCALENTMSSKGRGGVGVSRSRAAGRQGVSGEGLGLGRPPSVTRAPRPLQRHCNGRAGPSDAAARPRGASVSSHQPPRSPVPGPARRRNLGGPLRFPRLAPCAQGLRSSALRDGLGWPGDAQEWPGGGPRLGQEVGQGGAEAARSGPGWPGGGPGWPGGGRVRLACRGVWGRGCLSLSRPPGPRLSHALSREPLCGRGDAAQVAQVLAPRPGGRKLGRLCVAG